MKTCHVCMEPAVSTMSLSYGGDYQSPGFCEPVPICSKCADTQLAFFRVALALSRLERMGALARERSTLTHLDNPPSHSG